MAGHGRGSACEPHSPGLVVLQVAEMHGELIEFNERLHRALVAKEALVSQMRQELIDLRGPVSTPARLLLAVDAAHDLAVQSVHCWQCQAYTKAQTWEE